MKIPKQNDKTVAVYWVPLTVGERLFTDDLTLPQSALNEMEEDPKRQGHAWSGGDAQQEQLMSQFPVCFRP